MAHGQRAAQNSNKRKELWSPRPFSGVPTSKVAKKLCHRKERRMASRDIHKQVNGD